MTDIKIDHHTSIKGRGSIVPTLRQYIQTIPDDANLEISIPGGDAEWTIEATWSASPKQSVNLHPGQYHPRSVTPPNYIQVVSSALSENTTKALPKPSDVARIARRGGF